MRRTTLTIALALSGIAGFAAIAAPAHAAGTIPPDSTDPPASDAPADTTATAEIEPAGGSAVIFVDESGSELAAISAPSVEPAWAGYGEGDEPESGHEYLRITVAVESRSPRGLFDVGYDDFMLQDADGFATRAQVVPTAEQSAAEEEPISEAELANGETVELALTFEVVSGVKPSTLFYSPSSDRLVTVLALG